MKLDEQRKLENQLIVMGLNKLHDPNLVPQMARLIPGHEIFAGMLNECDQDKRREMYEAMRPYLRFKPLPLDTYMNQFKEKANAIDSQTTPISIGKQKFEEVAPEEATQCIATLTCAKCTRQKSYIGDTPAAAATAARQAGWVRDLTLQKEICPKCPAVYDDSAYTTGRTKAARKLDKTLIQ